MQQNESLFEQAQNLIPGGVNSPVRSLSGVDQTPVYFVKGNKSKIIDINNNSYIDYVCSWGAVILGHADERVNNAVKSILDCGTSFGAVHPYEIEIAQEIVNLVPGIEKIRMVNSGTEATMTAIRLARGYTDKKYLIKFNGCYHGHSDSLLVNAGSGLMTFGIPSSLGILPELAQFTLTAEYNDIASVKALFEKFPEDIAGVIIEPIAGNMGMIKPKDNFLQQLRELCTSNGSLLIMDEVMTGFRVALEGASHYFGVEADLITLGKVIGGGLPVGALGGKSEIMDFLAPSGKVYQAGTLSGNPLVLAAGLGTIRAIKEKGFYENLSSLTGKLTQGLAEITKVYQLPFKTSSLGGMFGFYFNDEVENYHDVKKSDITLFKKFYNGMLNFGIYFAPSMYEAGFITSAHSDDDIDYTLNCADKVCKTL